MCEFPFFDLEGVVKKLQDSQNIFPGFYRRRIQGLFIALGILLLWLLLAIPMWYRSLSDVERESVHSMVNRMGETLSSVVQWVIAFV